MAVVPIFTVAGSIAIGIGVVLILNLFRMAGILLGVGLGAWCGYVMIQSLSGGGLEVVFPWMKLGSVSPGSCSSP